MSAKALACSVVYVLLLALGALEVVRPILASSSAEKRLKTTLDHLRRPKGHGIRALVYCREVWPGCFDVEQGIVQYYYTA